MGWKMLLPFIGGEEQFLLLFEEVREVGSFRSLNDIILLTSASVEKGFLTFHTHFSNEAQIGTAFTFKGGMLITALAQIESFKGRPLPDQSLHGQDGHTDGSGHIVILRNSDLLIADVFKSCHHSLVAG